MKARSGGPNAVWVRDRVREADDAFGQGHTEEAVTLLYDLAEHCRAAARSALSEWHEIQARWLLGVRLEGLSRHREAAAEYGRIVLLRRQALQEASRGLGDATAAAALCELRAGRRTTGLRLALEALRMHRTYPLAAAMAKRLEGEVARVQRSKTRTRRRR